MVFKVALQSDFRDFYDHQFCDVWKSEHDAVFRRFSYGGMARPAMLTYLECYLGLPVPAHGVVCELVPRLTAGWEPGIRAQLASRVLDLVVYSDAHAHAGEAKVRMSAAQALCEHPDAYATQFIPADPSGKGKSLRYLRVGRRQFWLRYTSHDDWRSNCGDVEIEVLSEKTRADDEALRKVPHPLVAVDFVPADQLYAVDLNLAPCLAGTGLEKRLSSAEVAAEIAGAMAMLEAAV